MKYYLLICGILILSLQACKTEKAESEQVTVANNRDDYQLIVEKQGCDQPKEACVDIKVKYPTLGEYEQRDKESIHNYIRGYLADFMVSDKPIQSKSLKAFLQESAKAIASNSRASYKFHSTFKPIFEGENIICLENIYELKEGKEADYKAIGYLIFDLETGDIIPIDDIISDEIALKILLLNAIKQKENADISADISSLGYLISDRDFAVTNNIGITPDKIIFSYSPLEIADEEKGSITIEKNKSEVAGYLNKAFLEQWK